MMLYTKYQGSRPYGITQEDFFTFLLIKAYVKDEIPLAKPFLVPGMRGSSNFCQGGGGVSRSV